MVIVQGVYLLKEVLIVQGVYWFKGQAGIVQGVYRFERDADIVQGLALSRDIPPITHSLSVRRPSA